MAPVTLRPPTFSKAHSPADYKNPTIGWLIESWHVTHSSLPMWKTKRNVRIEYTPLEPSDPAIPLENTDRIDDLVSYQNLGSEKIWWVNGVDKVAADTGESRGEWDFRGKGLLKVAGSHWEILGWGEEEGTGNKWVVTCFEKTIATPAGVDLYSKLRSGLKVETVEGIKQALSEAEDDDVKGMARELFEVKIDDARKEPHEEDQGEKVNRLGISINSG